MTKEERKATYNFLKQIYDASVEEIGNTINDLNEANEEFLISGNFLRLSIIQRVLTRRIEQNNIIRLSIKELVYADDYAYAQSYADYTVNKIEKIEQEIANDIILLEDKSLKRK